MTHMQTEKVSFRTSDGVTIVADHYAGEEGGPSALLLHMMPATRESWREFPGKLADAGYSHVLAFDQRGHGESTGGPGGARLDYKLFEDKDQMAKMLDVEAAVKFMEDNYGAVKDRLAVVGASIGANLAIQYGSEHNEVPAVIALSPGLNYRGVTTADKMESYGENQSLYLAASDEDTGSFMADRKLAELNPRATVKEFSGAGHGTAMFGNELAFMDELITWLSERVK